MSNKKVTFQTPPPPPPSTTRTRLLQEADDLLAQSYLIFLYSDLRLLSATGRVRTKFEDLSIDSDNVVKNNAPNLAVLQSEIANMHARSTNSGISPAQIMAALMVELRREVQAKRRRERNNTNNEQQGDNHNDSTTTNNTSSSYSILSTITDRKNRKVIEEDMDSLLKAYNYMIGMDLKKELPTVRRSVFGGNTEQSSTTQSPTTATRIQAAARMSMFANRMRGQQRRGGGDGGAPNDEEDDDNNNNNKDATGDNTPPPPPTTTTDTSSPPPLPTRGQLQRGTSARRLPVFLEDVDETEVAQVGDAFFQAAASSTSTSGAVSEQELLDLMEDAVKARDYGRLDFMRDFFRPDSVSAVMIQSDTRIVWMNDWYPLKDLTYAVAVNKEKKEVLLVFRGAITKADWAHATNWDIKKVENPIEEDYQDKSPYIDVHTGFYRYLFRIRKDTGTRKYDEIKTVVHEYGSKLIGDDYRLIVTGHSLGAALSTVFGLFASADERFTSRGPIKMYTFGSPYVGAKNFLMAFRHQELTRKIQYLRMHNVRDGVAHMPIGWRGRFQHVGVSIKIHRLPAGCWKWRGQRRPTVYYGKEKSNQELYWKAFRENWFFNMPLPWNTAKAHTLHELRKRLLPAVELLDEERLNITLDQLYEELVYKEEGDKKEDA